MRRVVGFLGSCVAVLLISTGCSTRLELSGGQLFASNCAACHGRYGEGDGPVAADASLVMPDLRYLSARNGGVFPRDRVADIIDGRAIVKAHGERQMPVWGDAFAELDAAAGSAKAHVAAKIEALVDYLASTQQAK